LLRELNSSQKALDSWLPTLVRYLGLIAMGYGIFFDRGANPALIPAATGMILFKTVYGGGGKE
jgi:hypothetical protein